MVSQLPWRQLQVTGVHFWGACVGCMGTGVQRYMGKCYIERKGLIGVGCM
jgi:hypothetical protein